jgi:hypothetical protein
MNLDFVAAALCGWVALCVFGLHIVSSPRRHRWMTLPEYVRRGLLVTGAMFTWRSVNFATLRGGQIGQPGHINIEGVMASLALAYMVTSLVFWAASRHLPGKGWERLRWVERKERESEANVPVIMTAAEVETHARSKGLTVNAQPPESLH